MLNERAPTPVRQDKHDGGNDFLFRGRERKYPATDLGQ